MPKTSSIRSYVLTGHGIVTDTTGSFLTPTQYELLLTYLIIFGFKLKYRTYVVGEDDAPLPDLILPVDLRQTVQQTGNIFSSVIAFTDSNNDNYSKLLQ